jgi:type III secretion protein L
MKLFTLINQDSVHLTTKQKIIPKEEFSQLLAASELVQKTEEEREIAQRQNIRDCEIALKKSREEGFKEGLESLNAHIIHYEMELRKAKQLLQEQVITLALQAAKKIVARQIELNPETIVDIVLQAMAPLKQHRRFIIKVSKGNQKILQEHKEQIKEVLEYLESLIFMEQEDILPGECLIETEKGIISTRLSTQFEALEKAFKKYIPPSGPL